MVRYFTDESFAFTEEFSVFLMVVLAFVGRRRRVRAEQPHPRDLLRRRSCAPRRALAVELAVVAVAIALFAAIGGYGVRLVLDDLRFETTSPGIGVPAVALHDLAPAARRGHRDAARRPGCAPAQRQGLSMAGEGALLLAAGFVLLLLAGAPLAVVLGATGAFVILVENLGIMSVPTNVYAGIAKYPLLALPVFILAGMMFERAGVALRIVRFMSALVGSRRGAQGVVAILVCMLLGGISGSGPADAAAVAMVMIPAMAQAGLSARVLGEPDRGGGLDRDPHSALDRVHRLQRAGAAGERARAVRGRGHPRHARRAFAACCRCSTSR